MFFVATSAYATNVTLGVTQISAVSTFAQAGGDFAGGWKWNFNITVPDNEPVLNMKFADWTNGASTIPAGSNIRFYSAQSSNASAPASAITIASAGTYSSVMNLTNGADLDAVAPGRQIQVTVEARIPTGSAGGSYSTSYGINSVADTVAPVITLNGDASVTLEAGSVYSDAGATALDNVDGNVTSSIVTVNSVNTSVLGAQTVTYNVSDTAGNPATQITRTVTVTASDISALTTAKGIADGLILANATESTTPGDHVVGSLATLTSANTAANATNASAQSVVDAQVVTLNSAISAYNLAIVGASDISALTTAKGIADGLILASATESTTPGDHVVGSLATLTSANTAANATNASAQSVVDAQVVTLNSAISAYNAAIVP